MEEKEPMLKVILEAESREYIFIAPIKLKITYENSSSSQLSFKDPDKVWETHFVAIHHGEENDEVFGKIEMTHPDKETSRSVEPEAEMITLKPNGLHLFECDAAIRFYSLFHPGQFDIMIRDVSDDDLTMESNSIAITVRFKNESVARLMVVVSDETQAVAYRIWAADWLKKLKNDFSPRFASDEEPDDIRESSRASIAEEVGKFRAWWVTFEKSDAAYRLLAELNEKYFKQPVAGDEDDFEEEEMEEDEL